jgi:hypothetical protein
MSDARTSFSQTYSVCPIFLVGGIASGLPNGTMPITDLLPDPTSSSLSSTEDDSFAVFKPMSGGTLQDWAPAEYPFASMIMAANAVVQNALRISLLMICPAKNSGNNYINKNSNITTLMVKITNHISQGGYFLVLTPAYTYSNVLLIDIVDVTNASDKQVQSQYQWNFKQPLITAAQAAIVYNNVYNKLASGLPVPNPVTNSGPSVVVNPPNSSVPTP